MGFCSGTDIFDHVAKAVFNSSLSNDEQKEIITALVEALEDHDWDCHDDSAYIKHKVVHRVMHELHPDWFEEGQGDA